jgi:uncharacterized protein YbjT (DUF2867 family)
MLPTSLEPANTPPALTVDADRGLLMNVVTGAFGFIGRHIARGLLESGEAVRTITTHPDKPNPFGSAVEAMPYNFHRPDDLVASLRGASTLFNTYWVRFEYGGSTFEQAIRNTVTLFDSAKRAGVKRVVHVSVTNPSLESPLAYYRGKARQEQALVSSGLPYAIVRPTLVFGDGDILVNNIAWLLRTFPVFPIGGAGDYRLQPVHVRDVATIAIACGREPHAMKLDAVGPETFTFEELVRVLAAKLKPKVRFVHLPPALTIALGQLVGLTLGDVLLTRAELQGLMDEMLTSKQAPNAPTRFTEWIEENWGEVGRVYSSELGRHFIRRGRS